MSDVEIDLLISLVQERPVLWDKSLEEYKYKNLTLKGWEEVCSILNNNFEKLDEKEKKVYGNSIIKKWKNIKDCWMKNKKKVSSEKKSGAGARKTKKYVYDDQLQFLKKNLDIDDTTASFSTNKESNTASNEQNENLAVVADIIVNDGASTSVNENNFQNQSSLPSNKKKKKDDIDKEFLRVLSEKEDRHLSFFRGILPSLQNFDEAKTRKFQMAVLQAIDNIENNNPVFISAPHLQQNLYHYSGSHTMEYRSSADQQNAATSPSTLTNLSNDFIFDD